MRVNLIRSITMAVAFVIMSMPAVSALTVEEIADLCRAGYGTEDILEFTRTLGVDQPLGVDDIDKLDEAECLSEITEELARLYGTDEAREYVANTEVEDDEQPAPPAPVADGSSDQETS